MISNELISETFKLMIELMRPVFAFLASAVVIDAVIGCIQFIETKKESNRETHR